MKKKSKFGLNTGNTISFGTNYSYIKRYNGDQNIVVKFLRNKHVQPANFRELNEHILNEATSMVNDGEIDGTIKYPFNGRDHSWCSLQEEVYYSLNKRKRWTLKDRILKSIENIREQQKSNETNPGGKQFSISLTERAITPHLWKNLNEDCTDYHNSCTKEVSTYPSSKYSNETDLKNKANPKPVVDKKKEKKEKRRKGHNQHFRDLQRQTNDFGKKKEKEHEEQLEKNMNRLQQAHPVGQERSAENQTPEIHYEICTPRPLIAHHLYYDSNPYYLGPYYNRLRPSNKSRSKCKHFRDKFYQAVPGYGKKQLIDIVKYKTTTDEEMYEQSESETNFELYENVFLESEETVLENLLDNESENCINFSHVFDKVEKDRNNNKLKQKPNKHHKQKRGSYTGIYSGIANYISSCPLKLYGKGETIYEPKIYRNAIFKGLKASKLQETVAPLSIKMDSETLHPKCLESVYKEAYMEGCSVPRCFMINLSIYKCQKSQMEQNQEESALYDPFDIGGVYAIFKETPKPVGVLCVNKHSSEEFINVSKFNTVGLNIDGDFDNREKIGIQQRLGRLIKDHTMITVKQVTDLIIKTMQKKYYKFFKGVKTKGIYRRKENSLYEHFSCMHEWDLKFYHPEDAYLVVKDTTVLGHKQKVKKYGSLNIVHSRQDIDGLCDICLTSTYTDGIVNGTSLLSCHHWFCNDCWIEYLLQAISNGIKVLECPGYECNSLVDSITLMSLLGYRMYEKHWKQVQSSKLDCSPQWTWCPHSSCNQTVCVLLPSIQDPSEKKVCVHCVCNQTWCYDCKLEPHWPIPCHMADTYFKLIKQRGLDKYYAGRLYYVEVKKCWKCKQCKYPLKKRAELRYIYCRLCHFSFCDDCLHSADLHTSSKQCPSSSKVKLSKYGLDDAVDDLQKEQYFKIAVDFRQQKRLKEDRLKGRILAVIENNQWSHTTNRKQFISSLNSDITKINDNEYYRKIKNMAGYLFELYHFLEFSYVFVSRISPKHRKILTDNLLIISLHAKQLSKLLYEEKIHSMTDLIEQCDSIHGLSLARLKIVATNINLIQEKLEK